MLRLGELQKPLAPGRTYTVGRANECDITLGHGSIGQMHCSLEVREAGVVVRDLESLAGSGVQLAGVRVMEGVWAPGQTLRIGEIDVELECAAAVMTMDEVAAAAAKLAPHGREPQVGELMV